MKKKDKKFFTPKMASSVPSLKIAECKAENPKLSCQLTSSRDSELDRNLETATASLLRIALNNSCSPCSARTLRSALKTTSRLDNPLKKCVC